MERGGRASRGGIFGWVPWRLLLLTGVLVAVGYFFFCDVLRVPSGSMEPTLHGDPTTGDEILVCKPWYKFNDPQRFDLVVFERKGDDVASDERVAVKRVGAIGGESVRIDDGDLYVTPRNGDERRIVKKYSEFRSLLVPLWVEPFDASVTTRLLSRDDGTVFAPGAGAEGGALVLTGELDQRDAAVVTLASDAVKFEDGWIDARRVAHEGTERVHDVLFELEVELQQPTLVLTFEFSIGGDEFEFTLMPKAPGHTIEFMRRAIASGASHPESNPMPQVSPGKKHKLEFWQIDGAVGFAVDGKVEFDTVLQSGPRALQVGGDVQRVSFAAWHGSARLTGFSVWRDLHWTSPSDAAFARGGEPTPVPPGELFVLGDHSSDSVDSRHYGPIAVSSLVGAPLFIVAPSRRFRWLR